MAYPIVLALALVAGSAAQASQDASAATTAATLAPAPARSGELQHCVDLPSRVTVEDLTLTVAELVPAGELATHDGGHILAPAHCLVRGELLRRTSAVDGKGYAIGFEMRLPQAWSGRFFYQANGGLDGVVLPATGPVGPSVKGSAPDTALGRGFAVMSSDAGHAGSVPFFGADPQARLDYGYMAVGRLSPVARALVAAAYGREPDRSYIGGCSNGGRHALVAAQRYGAQYDGVLAGAPGMQLPRSALAQVFKAQQYASIARTHLAQGPDAGLPDVKSAISPAQWALLGRSVVARCDALDGAHDGMVLDTAACQAAFDIQRDVPSCAPDAAASDESAACLSVAQKEVLTRVFAGAHTGSGQRIYSPFYWDAGVGAPGYASWHFSYSTQRDPGALAFIFNTPPVVEADWRATTGLKAALSTDLDAALRRIFATTETFTQSAWDFMTPPEPAAGQLPMQALHAHGGKVLVYHGVADPVFSAKTSVDWFERVQAAYAAQGMDAGADLARLYLVPGMNHCSGGPATDTFDALGALVAWVEEGRAPEAIVATARGTDARVPNADVPAEWHARSRVLCPWPKVPRLLEVAQHSADNLKPAAAAFVCR